MIFKVADVKYKRICSSPMVSPKADFIHNDWRTSANQLKHNINLFGRFSIVNWCLPARFLFIISSIIRIDPRFLQRNPTPLHALIRTTGWRCFLLCCCCLGWCVFHVPHAGWCSRDVLMKHCSSFSGWIGLFVLGYLHPRNRTNWYQKYPKMAVFSRELSFSRPVVILGIQPVFFSGM